MAKLQNALSIDVPSSILWEYEYESGDGTRTAKFNLIGEVEELRLLLLDALSALPPAQP